MPTKKRLSKKAETDALKYFSEDVVNPFFEAAKAHIWKPGQSGNPKGRLPAPDVGLTEMLAYVLGKDGSKKLARKLIDLATGERPNLQAIMYIYDRLEGKPRQQIIETKDNEDPLVRLLERVIDDSKALEGHRIPSLPVVTTYSIDEAEVREGDS